MLKMPHSVPAAALGFGAGVLGAAVFGRRGFRLGTRVEHVGHDEYDRRRRGQSLTARDSVAHEARVLFRPPEILIRGDDATELRKCIGMADDILVHGPLRKYGPPMSRPVHLTVTHDTADTHPTTEHALEAAGAVGGYLLGRKIGGKKFGRIGRGVLGAAGAYVGSRVGAHAFSHRTTYVRASDELPATVPGLAMDNGGYTKVDTAQDIVKRAMRG